jgi:hypothetical protein
MTMGILEKTGWIRRNLRFVTTLTHGVRNRRVLGVICKGSYPLVATCTTTTAVYEDLSRGRKKHARQFTSQETSSLTLDGVRMELEKTAFCESCFLPGLMLQLYLVALVPGNHQTFRTTTLEHQFTQQGYISIEYKSCCPCCFSAP